MSAPTTITAAQIQQALEALGITPDDTFQAVTVRNDAILVHVNGAEPGTTQTSEIDVTA